MSGGGAEGARTPRMAWRMRDGVAWLRLDDGKANAMNAAWLTELEAVLDAVEAQSACRVLVIQGRPGFFSGGLDLKELPGLPAESLRRTTDAFMAAMRRVFLFPRPVLALSTGHAIAGGMMLYLAADERLALASEEARYGLNEATNGIPLLGATAGICQYGIPREYHTDMILHGRMLTAAESHARRITRSLESDVERLEARALERARELFAVEPRAYAINKRLLREPAIELASERAAALAREAPSVDVFRSLSRA